MLLVVLGLSCLLLFVIYSLFDCVRCGGGFDAGGVGCGFWYVCCDWFAFVACSFAFGLRLSVLC